MELYSIGSILLDISIGLLVIGALVRLILAMSYFRRNKSTSGGSPSAPDGKRTLTEGQRKTMRRAIIPISVAGLTLAITSLVLLCLS